MKSKVTKKPVSLVATGYREASNYSKLIATAKKLEAKKGGNYSQQELISLLTKNFSHRKLVGKKRTVAVAWKQDFYVVANADHKSNGGKSRWEGTKESGRLVTIGTAAKETTSEVAAA